MQKEQPYSNSASTLFTAWLTLNYNNICQTAENIVKKCEHNYPQQSYIKEELAHFIVCELYKDKNIISIIKKNNDEAMKYVNRMMQLQLYSSTSQFFRKIKRNIKYDQIEHLIYMSENEYDKEFDVEFRAKLLKIENMAVYGKKNGLDKLIVIDYIKKVLNHGVKNARQYATMTGLKYSRVTQAIISVNELVQKIYNNKK